MAALGTKLRTLDYGHGRRALTFWCPGCAGPHAIGIAGEPPWPCWTWDGNVEQPTFAPSILVSSAEKTLCHSFVRAGKIEFLADCAHALAGQTIELPPWPASFDAGDEEGEAAMSDEPKQEEAAQAPAEKPVPTLLESLEAAGKNLVQFGQHVLAVPHALGSIDLALGDNAQHPDIIWYYSLEDAKACEDKPKA